MKIFKCQSRLLWHSRVCSWSTVLSALQPNRAAHAKRELQAPMYVLDRQCNLYRVTMCMTNGPLAMTGQTLGLWKVIPL